MAVATRTADSIAFFLTTAHQCGYLPAQQAVNVVVDPSRPINTQLYSRLAWLGFRRSGERVYRPACPGCTACIPLRVPAKAFRPSRTQRRVWLRNNDLVVRERDPAFDEEHFALYRQYIAARHPHAGMDDASPAGYISFIFSEGIETRLVEFRASGRCVAVAVMDLLEDGYSAVYTFFDTSLVHRSLGVYAIMWQIEAARRAEREWLYLGYWIRDCRKMSYKTAYRPYELLVDGRWSRFEGAEGLHGDIVPDT